MPWVSHLPFCVRKRRGCTKRELSLVSKDVDRTPKLSSPCRLLLENLLLQDETVLAYFPKMGGKDNLFMLVNV